MGMRFRNFTMMAFIGSAIWCTVLTVFGLLMSRDMEVMVQYGVTHESASCKHAFLNLTIGTAILVALVAILYIALLKRHHAVGRITPAAKLPETK